MHTSPDASFGKSLLNARTGWTKTFYADPLTWLGRQFKRRRIIKTMLAGAASAVLSEGFVDSLPQTGLPPVPDHLLKKLIIGGFTSIGAWCFLSLKSLRKLSQDESIEAFSQEIVREQQHTDSPLTHKTAKKLLELHILVATYHAAVELAFETDPHACKLTSEALEALQHHFAGPEPDLAMPLLYRFPREAFMALKSHVAHTEQGSSRASLHSRTLHSFSALSENDQKIFLAIHKEKYPPPPDVAKLYSQIKPYLTAFLSFHPPPRSEQKSRLRPR